MATMQAPRAFYGRLDQSPILALTGHVRYVTVRALRTFIDDFVAREADAAMVIDLREVTAIDSTGMGLLARLGRSTLEHGRRSVIVCPVRDVMTCLRSAAFDRLFIIVERWPFEQEAELAEVPLESREMQAAIMGRLILDAHRDLASLSTENQETFAGVIAALEAELGREGRSAS
jgi:anti-anti-sigma factor